MIRRSGAFQRNVGALATALALAALPRPSAAAAQDPSELVDRIIAVVGDTAILQSELQEYLFRLQAQGVRPPQEPDALAEFMGEALEQKVNEVLLVVHARREGITVSESEINDVVDDRLAQVRRQFGSEADFQQALLREGITSAEFRIRLTEQVRSEILTQRYLQQRVSELQPVAVSDDEIRAVFEAQKELLGPKPATVSLKQVILTPRASDDAMLLARERAEQALTRARSGEDFERLAREYSDDTATRPKGGELGWVRRADLLPEFGEALYGMRAGQLSDLVETSVGLHIIKLERIRGNERFARHILIRPDMTDSDAERSRQLAEEIADALRAGADPDSLINLYGDPQERATLTNYPLDRLPPEYLAAVREAEAGDVIGPLQLPAPGLEEGKWIIAVLTDRSPGGDWTLDDVRETLRVQIQQDQLLKKVVDQLRESTYIETRLEDYPITRS